MQLGKLASVFKEFHIHQYDLLEHCSSSQDLCGALDLRGFEVIPFN
jgi:hypothetical protein